MMQAGMFDARPRSRELVYILVAERAARALGELFMQANQMTLEQAAAFACANTPRGWLRMDGQPRPLRAASLPAAARLRHELPDRQDRDREAARRAQAQLGDRFRMKAFMDDFNAAGLIPASLLRWELTGEMPEDVRRMLAPAERPPETH